MWKNTPLKLYVLIHIFNSFKFKVPKMTANNTAQTFLPPQIQWLQGQENIQTLFRLWWPFFRQSNTICAFFVERYYVWHSFEINLYLHLCYTRSFSIENTMYRETFCAILVEGNNSKFESVVQEMSFKDF